MERITVAGNPVRTMIHAGPPIGSESCHFSVLCYDNKVFGLVTTMMNRSLFQLSWIVILQLKRICQRYYHCAMRICLLYVNITLCVFVMYVESNNYFMCREVYS